MTTVINTRNVHQALPKALDLLDKFGVWRGSRNGPVIQYPEPVVTDYERPWERVIFWDHRDANPFFHLYEGLWMLMGRNDVKSLTFFAKNMANYSDDGLTVHGAYGHRWRNWYHHRGTAVSEDQLDVVIRRLRKNPLDRRVVVQMWDPNRDLDSNNKDVPCNLTITFQINHESKLDMTVFCRSNDIIWGAYGANAVHFSMLQEYIAVRLGIKMGRFHQMSVNWHAYEEQYRKLDDLSRVFPECPYAADLVNVIPMTEASLENIGFIVKTVDWLQSDRVAHVDEIHKVSIRNRDPWSEMVLTMMKAHYLFKILPAPERYKDSLLLIRNIRFTDWGNAAGAWLHRRMFKWEDQQ